MLSELGRYGGNARQRCRLRLGGVVYRACREEGEKSRGRRFELAGRRECLSIARKTLEAYLRTGDTPDFDSDVPELHEPGAAFVTLHCRGELRGCIGQTEARGPLWRCVREMAISAATQDPRFAPVTEAELSDVDIEVSVLSAPEPVHDATEIEIGRHGLIVTRDFYRGLLLPQVAPRYDWTPEEFLEHTCVKAGLPKSAWKDPKARIERFEARIFSEKSA
ncbi:MAG: AmmeMemoRadiSam system protein A [Deltaproteobacteria bacterium]|nr:AmmeMemoRadiSam system protein A [Deltaproteobacteria bacterium]